MSLDEDFLQGQGVGCVRENSLSEVLKLQNDTEESGEVRIIKHSPYYDLNQIVQTLQDKNKCFSVMSSNLDSINAKFNEVQAYIKLLNEENCEFSAMCFQECRIGENDDTCTIQIDGYQCISQGKICSSKGGLVIYLKDKYKWKIKNVNVNYKIWEGQFIEVSGGGLNKNIIIGNVYRPPHNTHSTFQTEFSSVLAKLEKCNAEVLIAGDCNINLLKISQTDSVFSDFFYCVLSHSFYPKITLPTRFSKKHGTLIDNVFCKLSNYTLDTTSGILIKKFSDHHPYFICFDSIQRKPILPKHIMINKQTPDAVRRFQEEVSNSNILNNLDKQPSVDPTENLNLIENVLISAKKKHLPSKFVRFNKHKHKKSEWITSGIIESIKFRDNLHKKLKTTPQNTHEHNTLKTNLDTYNHILKKNIRLAKINHYASCFNKFKGNIRKTWDTINEILNKTKKKMSFPDHFIENGQPIHDRLEIANCFNSFFTNIGPNLANLVTPTPNIDYRKFLNKNQANTFRFSQVDPESIEKIINNLQTKNSTGHDGISTKLIKVLKTTISEPLSIVINQCLNSGIFPEKLKIAKVIPLYKKDDVNIFTNYRPISLLVAISKIFERVIFNQLYAYFQKYKLFYSSQYGFRSGHSTEFACLELVDRIIQEMDRGKIPICIFLDLSKAFDTLDHTILLTKLEYYGITETAASLFKSYLSQRSQYVEFDGSKSDMKTISTGVPQGSILGPLLFIIYINDLSQVSQIFRSIMYADDTSLATTLNAFNINPTANTDEMINSELQKVSDWLKANKLSLNVNKSKFMVFHHPKKIFRLPQIKIDNSDVECVDNFNFLGITIDKNLNWKPHIEKIASKISRALGIINKLKHFIPLDSKITMYNTMILPHINYGILAWGFKNNRLITLQKRAIRIITVSKYNAHTEPLFKHLKLLNIKDILNISVLKFYHKYINKTLPDYFQNLPFQLNHEIHNHNTRGAHDLHIQRDEHGFANECIRYATPKLINSTPDLIKDKLATHSLHGFSHYVKNHFINKYKEICYIPNCYICQNT